MNHKNFYSGWLCLALSAVCVSAEDPEPYITNYNQGLAVVWPASATNWILEEIADPGASTVWAEVSPAKYVSEGNLRLFPIAGSIGSGLFRLRWQAPPVAGLSAQWHFDDVAATVLGNGVSIGSGFFSTNVGYGPGRVGPSCLRFVGAAAGARSRAWIANNGYSNLPPTGSPFSLSLWFNPDSFTNSWSVIAGNRSTNASGWQLGILTPGPGTNLLVFNGAPGSLSVTGRTTLLPGQWHSLAVTHDGTEGAINLDGSELARAAGTFDNGDTPIYFGGAPDASADFIGRVDEVYTYTNALTEDQLAVVGDWSFNEAGGVVCTDQSLFANHARLTGDARWVPGKEGASVDLSLGEIVISNDNQIVLPPTGGPFTLSFYLFPGALPLGASGLMNCGVPGMDGWEMTVECPEGDGKWLRFVATNHGGTMDFRAPLVLNQGTWTHVDLTHDGAIASLYQDGQFIQAGSGAIRGTRSALVVGAVLGTTNFNGRIDQLKIRRRALVDKEIGPVAQPVWETVFVNSVTNIALRGSGPRGKTLTYSLTPSSTPHLGTVSLAGDSGVITYNAGSNRGPETFTYLVSDGEFTSKAASVTLSVVQPHWISVTGGSAQLLDGSDPQHAWAGGTADALDQLWHTNTYYDCFFYAPGVYQTRGWKYMERGTANQGCKHFGVGSSGENTTTLQLTDIWQAWNEETIFGTAGSSSPCDGFEVQDLILDCNADNVPKYQRGEPIWIHIPLKTVGMVDSLTLIWASSFVQLNKPLTIGSASEFKVSARRAGTEVYSTNCAILSNPGAMETIPVGVEADELWVELSRKAPGIDFYGLSEIDIAGPPVNLPTAMSASGGESALLPQYDILCAVDGNGGTAWASAWEDAVEITLPLGKATQLTGINVQWNCTSNAIFGRFGQAADFVIQAHDEVSDTFYDVPFVRHPRAPGGWEASTFGSDQAGRVITTDRLKLLLTKRDLMVDHFSIRELALVNGGAFVPLPLPRSLNSMPWGGDHSVMRAFDKDPTTYWASSTQGAVAAINVTGSNLKFRNLKIKGFGTKAGRECFPLFVMPPRGGAGNVLVEDCVFTEPATNSTDGVSVVTLLQYPPVSLTNAVVRRCSVLGIRPRFSYSHAFTAMDVEDCLVDDCNVAVYFEPDGQTSSVGSVLVRSNQFLNVDHGVFTLFHAGQQFDSLTCVGNEIVLTGATGGGYGIGCCDTCSGGPSGSLTNLTVMHNTIRYSAWDLRPTGRDLGIFYSDIRNAVFGNNLLVLGTTNELRVRQYPTGIVYPPQPPEECDRLTNSPPGLPYNLPSLDLLPPGYRRAWFSNRTLSGALLPVRTVRFGVDYDAAQQQWP